jgi:hypothetical protein
VSATADNILITGQDANQADTLFFGSDNGDSYEGIRMNNGANGINIRNLKIIHEGTYSGADSAFDNICLNYDGQTELYVESVTMVINGFDGHAISRNSGSENWQSKNLKFDYVVCSSAVEGFTSRMSYDGAICFMGSLMPLSQMTTGDTGAYFHNCRFLNSPNAGIAFPQSGGTYCPMPSIVNCYIEVNERNTLYPHSSYQTDAMSKSNANSFAIVMYENGSGLIKGCTLTTGDTYYGTNGAIMIEGSSASIGSADSAVLIENNLVLLHHGFDSYYNNGVISKFIKTRMQAVDNLWIIARNNTVRGYVRDDTTNYPAYGPMASFMYFDVRFSSGQVLFENNHIKLFVLDSLQRLIFNRVQASAYTFVGGAACGGASFIIRNNLIETNDVYIGVGASDAGPTDLSGLSIYGDTLVIMPDSGDTPADAPAIVSHWDDGLANNHVGLTIYDLHIQSPHDTAYQRMRVRSGTSGEVDFTLKAIFTLIGQDQQGTPIPSCSLKIVNNYGTVLAETVGDANGRLVDTFSIAYQEENRTSIDSTFNDFTLMAVYQGDTTTQTMTIDGNPDSLELVLQNTLYSPAATRHKLHGKLKPTGVTIR